MSPKQKKIAAKAPPLDKIDGKDFAVLKAEKAKGRGMGLQDESIKPGKVQKAFLGKMIKGVGKGMGRLFGRKQSSTATPGAATMSGSGKGMGGMLPQLLQKAIDDGIVKTASKGKVMKAKMGKAVEYKKYLKGLKNAVDEVKKEKMERKGKEFIKRRKALGLSKGGGADTGRMGEMKSQISVAMDRAIKGMGSRPKLKAPERGPMKPMKKMGGGMMQRPMGYDYGGKVKTKPASKERKPEGIKDDTFDPIFNKPEGMKKELAIIQTEDAISRKNIGDGKKMTRRGLMKVVDAAADDKQLGRSLRKFQRDVFKTGGSVMARGCKLGRNKKTKLY